MWNQIYEKPSRWVTVRVLLWAREVVVATADDGVYCSVCLTPAKARRLIDKLRQAIKEIEAGK